MRTRNQLSNQMIITLWLLTCGLVYVTINAVATSPVSVHAEEFRTHPSMSDEEVISSAIQAAYNKGKNWWWINDAKTRVVLSKNRGYKFDPSRYLSADIEWKNHPAQTRPERPIYGG